MATSDSPTPAKHRPKSRFTRRGVIGAAGGVTAAGVLTPAVLAATRGTDNSTHAGTGTDPAGGPTEDFPETRAEETSGATEATLTFPISYVGVLWEGSRSGAAIRFPGEAGPDGWQELDDPADCGRVNNGATLVAAGGATSFQMRVPGGPGGLTCRAVDTEHGRKKPGKVPEDTSRMRGLAYLSRAEWGADESQRFDEDGEPRGQLTFFPVQVITVHHTATTNDIPDRAAAVRAVYDHHTLTNGWSDLGYHFLIDREGVVYEGRYSGENGLAGHNDEGHVVTGAHVGGNNSGNLGIALLGNLVEEPPTDAARDALVKLISRLTRVHGLDPRGETTFVNPVNGVERDVHVISGHQDWQATLCPGARMYAELDTVRASAAAR